jgi:protein-arginine kinase activator protein McsA
MKNQKIIKICEENYEKAAEIRNELALLVK